MTHWCIIPARAGSRRIPHKNTREFLGRPMLEYAVHAAAMAGKRGLFDKIVISTDDMSTSRAPYPLAVMIERVEIHERSPRLAQDEVGTLEVTRVVAVRLGVEDHDFVCCLYPCAGPFVTSDDLEQGEALVNGRPNNCAHAFAVGADPLRDAGQWYWSTGYALRQGTPLVGPATRLVVIPSHRVCDINTEEDWTGAEDMYRRWQEEKDDADPARASVGD